MLFFVLFVNYFRILLGAVGLIFVLLFVVYLLMLSYPARCHWLHRRFSTQYGLQGVTTREGLVAFLTRSTNQRSDGDYALGLYVMLSQSKTAG